MSSQDDLEGPDPYEQERAREPHETKTGPESGLESAGTPDAVEEASVTEKTDEVEKAEVEKAQKHRARGVEWVRMSDLMSRQTSRVAGRGIDLHTELTHRIRDPLLERTKAAARKLPPVAAFGRRGGLDRGATRSGVGMS
ncbi:hypothetical protein [Kocuria sp. 2SI]|uniref:hypothetical protein n=1 Tax=Kocuria sp. 2SI TaxID=2502203 RepID=UPI0010F9880C|nr:hypothetical protein [Kocuria sp. 2SI]